MREEKVLLNATLCFVVEGEKILLAEKTDKICKGYLNGYGGGIEPGEKEREAAIREVKEESGGITGLPENLKKMAIVDFHNTKTDGEIFTCRVHVFFLNEFSGRPNDTKEAIKSTWFRMDEAPLDRMAPGDKYWIPYILKGEMIKGWIPLGPYQKELTGEPKIKVVNFLSEDEN